MPTQKQPKPIQKADFDTSVRPQDDFYRYVNGGWFKRSTIPPTENRWGAFHVLHDKTRKRLHAILKDLVRQKPRRGSDQAKLRDLYLSAMDMRARNKQGATYLAEGFDLIDSFNGPADIPRIFGWLHARGVDAPWRLWVDQDDKNSDRMVLRIGQGGIGVPNKNYYVKNDKESRRIRDAYARHIARILELEGHYKKRNISNVVATILRIEKRLAKASMTPVEQRDVHRMYNKRSAGKLAREFGRIPWKMYFDVLGVPAVARAHIIVDQPGFLKETEVLLTEFPPEDWRIYLHWHFLDSYAGTLGEAFVNERFVYHGRDLQGLTEVPELWKRSVSISTGLMGDAVGKLYVKKYFPPSAKREIERLVKNLIAAYRVRIKALAWMTPATKKRALRKLDTMSLQLGYPDTWESYRKLPIGKESFTKNVLAAAAFHFARDMKKLAKPTDRREWHMPAPTVNAYYSPNANQITFPAGILQPPFFYPDADEAVNYGAIGAVIGHELTHGFDDQGALFDERGNLKNWWTKGDQQRFVERAEVLEKQFNRYHVADGIPVNGKLTLGENIADLGGLIIAYEAFKMATAGKPQKNIDNFTPDQRFFISHALTERCLVRDEFVKYMVLNDPHSPSEFRSNGPVSNCDAFYEAFGVAAGDALFRRPQDRAIIW